MKLSLIVPVYNAEKYLTECLTSIVAELTDEMELIIVNDGSTDSSSKICKQFECSNVRIFENDNHGVSYSRNFGIDKAIGEYICFIDADDILSKNWSKNILENLNSAFDYIIFLSNITNNIEKEKLLEYTFKVDDKFHWISTPWSKIYKKELLNKYQIRFKNGVINGEDMLFNAEVILSTDNISYVDCNIYNYRVNPLSVTKTFKDRLFKSDQFFLQYLQQIFEQQKLSCVKYYNYCLENAIMMFLDKISLLKKEDRSKYYYIFTEEPYNAFIINSNKFKNKLNKIIIQNLKNKKINKAIYLISIKKKLKEIIKHEKKQEYLIKI